VDRGDRRGGDVTVPPDPERAIDSLFRTESPALFRHACVITQGDRSAADDLVQDTFLAAIREWATLAARTGQGQRSWLYTVLRNKGIDRWRREWRHVPEPFDGMLATIAADDDVACQALSSIAVDRLWEEMQKMPVAQYRVALLSWWYGWPTKRIAAELEIAPSTVRVHRHRAARMLRSLIDEYGAADETDDRARRSPDEQR
jgi:RNA polymerase sigma-70 factor, ECF subfamily